MSYTYITFIQALGVNMAAPNAINWPTSSLASLMAALDPATAAILPTIVDYAEQRCYRELDLIAARSEQNFGVSPLKRAFNYSAAFSLNPLNPQQILIPERLILYPPGTALPLVSPVDGSPCSPVSSEFIDMVFYSSTFFAKPRYFAVHSDQLIILGPTPDLGYVAHLIGKARPVPLYSATPPASQPAGTQTTFLTSVLPDLFLAAAMVSASAFQKNFGAQSDDPRMAVAWEAQFQTLLASAKAEETRKKMHGWMQTAESEPPPNPPGTPGPPP